MLLGPLGWRSWSGVVVGLLAVCLLTLLTQVLGLVLWLAMGLASRWERPWAALGVWAFAGWMASLALVPILAGLGGREALPCGLRGPLRARSIGYCLAHRHYVVPALAEDARAIASATADRHPGTVVRYLDAGFPFAGMPLLPHLSHHDGAKLDLALLYLDEEGSPLDGGGSPIGYFGYVPLAAHESPYCAPATWDLRWDLDPLQPWLAPHLDEERTATLVREATRRPGIRKLLLEPHVRRRLGVHSEKIRFQGCAAARHDDHLHIQR